MALTPAHNEYISISGETLDSTNTDSSYYTAAKTGAVNKTVTYQDALEDERDIKKSLLDEIDANLQYTVMSMTIWVPLAAIAGYYLYKRNFSLSSSTQP